MAQYTKTNLYVDNRVKNELAKYPRQVQIKFAAAFRALAEKGFLVEPEAKKLVGTNNLFEIRIKERGQWRSIYYYRNKGLIVVLSVFQKKSQNTPRTEITKAIKRMQEYEHR